MYELESLDDEIKRVIIKDGYFREENYPFVIKPNFSTVGSFIKIKPKLIGTPISFFHDGRIRDLIRFDSVVIYEKCNLSQNPVDLLWIDNIFFELDIAQGMALKGKRSGIIHNWTISVNPGYEQLEGFAGGISWYMRHSKDFILSISFKLKNENNEIVWFIG